MNTPHILMLSKSVTQAPSRSVKRGLIDTEGANGGIPGRLCPDQC